MNAFKLLSVVLLGTMLPRACAISGPETGRHAAGTVPAAASVKTPLAVVTIAHADIRPTPKLEIPRLNWTRRSDWVDVKADDHAVGDGVADDTAALQTALDHIDNGSVIFLPAGTYRITKTLKISLNLDPSKGSPHRALGAAIIGQGSATKLVWDGPAGQEMLVESGLTASRYIGFELDGRDKATVGLDHFGQTGTFETEVIERDLEFHNFTQTGILCAVQPATAETTMENCVFDHCAQGIGILNFNEYDYTVTGCEFRNCGTGIIIVHGNAYIRDDHFEASSKVDMDLTPEHSVSVRRCTSLGSHRFITYTNPVSPVTVEDCRVASWTDPTSAVSLNGAPVVIFDTAFSNPPSKAPPVQLTATQKLFVSDNSSVGTDGLYTPATGQVYQIPAGERHGPLLRSAAQQFLITTEAVPSVVYDAKTDFGAKGDGRTDDSAAIQKAIDAARDHGKGAIAYLPSGVYLVSKSLNLAGADYSVGGSGHRTDLLWHGEAGATMMTVQDPHNVTLENMTVGTSDTGAVSGDGFGIVQTSTGQTPSMMTYDNVTVYGGYAKDPFVKGLWLRGLNKSSTVRVRQMDGNIHIEGSQRATILVDVSYEGAIDVSGKTAQRDGFLGVMTHLCTISHYTLYVKDSNNLVVSDFYMEQAENGYNLSGDPSDPAGRVTIQGANLLYDLSATNTKVSTLVDNYHGEINIGPQQYYTSPPVMDLKQTGTAPVSVVVWASTFYGTKLEVQKTDAATVSFLGCINVGTDLTNGKVDDSPTPTTLAQIGRGLDDLRQLGAVDLQINYPGVKMAR